MALQQIQRCGSKYEMAKATVQFALQAKVVKRLREMRMVQVRVHAEDLQENGLAD